MSGSGQIAGCHMCSYGNKRSLALIPNCPGSLAFTVPGTWWHNSSVVATKFYFSSITVNSKPGIKARERNAEKILKYRQVPQMASENQSVQNAENRWFWIRGSQWRKCQAFFPHTHQIYASSPTLCSVLHLESALLVLRPTFRCLGPPCLCSFFSSHLESKYCSSSDSSHFALL